MFIADKAIREMNRIEKNIVRGYLNAVKYASLLESRVRIVLVGDTGSGQQIIERGSVVKGRYWWW